MARGLMFQDGTQADPAGIPDEVAPARPILKIVLLGVAGLLMLGLLLAWAVLLSWLAYRSGTALLAVLR